MTEQVVPDWCAQNKLEKKQIRDQNRLDADIYVKRIKDGIKQAMVCKRIELYVIVPKAVQSRVISCMRKDGYVMKQAVCYQRGGKEMYMSKFGRVWHVLWSVKSLISVDRWYYGPECIVDSNRIDVAMGWANVVHNSFPNRYNWLASGDGGVEVAPLFNEDGTYIIWDRRYNREYRK